MSLDPITVLREATKEVPAVKYASGAAGVAAAGAIIVYFLGYDKASVIVLGGTFIAMVLLYAFSSMIASKTTATTIPGIILAYAVVMFFCIFLLFTVTAFGFYWPRAWADVLNIKHPNTDQSIIDRSKHVENNWSDLKEISKTYPLDDRHCESNCRNEPTKRFYPITLSVPPVGDGSKFRLTSPKLECIGYACQWSKIEEAPVLSFDGQSYSATVSNWGHSVAYKFTATVQKSM